MRLRQRSLIMSSVPQATTPMRRRSPMTFASSPSKPRRCWWARRGKSIHCARAVGRVTFRNWQIDLVQRQAAEPMAAAVGEQHIATSFAVVVELVEIVAALGRAIPLAVPMFVGQQQEAYGIAHA